MLCARVLMPPAHGATLKSVDTGGAEKAGARVVKDGGTIAVLHERRDVAERALGLIQAQWDRPRTGLDDKTIFDHLQKTGPKLQPAGESGNLAEGEKLAASIVERTYWNSYVAHATMETHSALARIEDGKVTVWASTQAPFSVRGAVAQALGVEPRNVRIITPYVGGGFGGKSAAEQAVEAARLAKITGRPVQVIRDRAEEFFYDTFRPAAVVKIRSGLSGGGKIVLWDYQVWGAGNGGARILLRRAPPAHGILRGLAGRQPAGHAPVRHRPVARAVGQFQHLRDRIAHGHPGGPGRQGSPGVPPESPRRRTFAAGAGDRRKTVRLEARQSSQRPRRGDGHWHLLEYPRGHFRRSDGG